MWTVKCRVRSVKCKVYSVKCRVCSVECNSGVQGVECKV